MCAPKYLIVQFFNLGEQAFLNKKVSVEPCIMQSDTGIKSYQKHQEEQLQPELWFIARLAEVHGEPDREPDLPVTQSRHIGSVQSQTRSAVQPFS